MASETYGATWVVQLNYLIWRNSVVITRNKIGRSKLRGSCPPPMSPDQRGARIFCSVIGLVLPTIFALLFGAIWSQRNTGQKEIQVRQDCSSFELPSLYAHPDFLVYPRSHPLSVSYPHLSRIAWDCFSW